MTPFFDKAKRKFGDFAYWLSVIIHPLEPWTESWGNDFPDKRFLIIRKRAYGSGIMAYLQSVLGWIAYAERHGLIPVVDLLHYPTIYHSKGEVGRVNIWEKFFEQPAGLSLSDVCHAKNVTIANASWLDEPDFLYWLCEGEDVEMDPKLLKWRRLVSRVIRIKQDPLMEFYNEQFEEALSNGVIGVLARGTDYVKLRPRGHPVQPDAEMLIAGVEERLNFKKEKKVYLATEDKGIAEKFSRHFGDLLILAKQDFPNYSSGYIGKTTELHGNLRAGFAYLKAMFDLSRCQALVAGRATGTIGAVLLSSGFSYSRAYNLGRY